MVEGDVVVGDIGKLRRTKVELRGVDVGADAVAKSAVEIDRPGTFVVAGIEFDALDDGIGVIERGERDGGAELAFVEQVLGDLVVGAETNGQAAQRLGRDALTGSVVITSGAATVPASVAIELALTWMSGGGVK